MTLTVRTPATLFHPETHAVLAHGIAVIWDDAHAWGGVFEAHERAADLRASVGAALTAQLQTADGRRATIVLTPSEFVADGERPLTFRGQGSLDTGYRRD